MSADILQSLVLGIVQGLGEFLPISSTAHLILAPYFFGWPDPGLAFNVALHAGTLIAALAYFWKDWKIIISNFPACQSLALAGRQFPIFNKKSKIKSLNNNYTLNRGREYVYNKNLLWFLAVATIPGVLSGYFLEEKAESVFRNPIIIAITLAVFGLILYLADKYIQHRKSISEVTLKDSIIIGLSQAIAIIPGVSRAGATITAGLATGLDRISAARFSFLLSTPIILGAAALKFPYLLKNILDINVLVGLAISAISGYLAIKYLLKFVEKAGYAVFFWYRLALSFIIFLVYFLK